MSQQQTPFTHTYLESKLRERLANALRFISGLSQEDVMKCGTSCLTEIIREYAITPPKLLLDSMYGDESIIEPVDITLERKTGYTQHFFFIPIEGDCNWLEEVDSQILETDGYPLAFLDKKRSRISIILPFFPEDLKGELKRRLDYRTGMVKQFADSVGTTITDFNKDLVDKMAAALNNRKFALIKAGEELENVGLPRVYNPAHKERSIQIHKLLQSLGEYMTNGSQQNMNSSTLLKKRFKVALSFPGEKREFVSQVAAGLQERLGDIFYDQYFEAELAQPDLDVLLQKIYHDNSDLIVVFTCENYDKKEWCGLEWRAIRDLLKQRKGDAIMPMRFDDTVIPGLFSIDGYIDLRGRTPEQAINFICQRINSQQQSH